MKLITLSVPDNFDENALRVVIAAATPDQDPTQVLKAGLDFTNFAFFSMHALMRAIYNGHWKRLGLEVSPEVSTRERTGLFVEMKQQQAQMIQEMTDANGGVSIRYVLERAMLEHSGKLAEMIMKNKDSIGELVHGEEAPDDGSGL